MILWKCFSDLAKSYERSKQFKWATNVWQFVINHSKPANKILPTMSIIICFLELEELHQAIASSSELVILLEAISDQNQQILDEYDLRMRKLVEKFFEFEQFDAIFQLLRLRFHLLKQQCNGEDMLDKISQISFIVRRVALAMQNGFKEDFFKNHYCFFDNILLFIQKLPESKLTTKSKCENVASFLHDYGFCCIAAEDYLKAISLFNQAIVLRKTVLGNESCFQQDFANCYHNLGWALDCSLYHREAIAAYQTCLEIEEQVQDYRSEEERNKSISLTTDLLLKAEKKTSNS